MSVISLSKNYTGFDPRTIPGCTLWLDAADSSSLTLSGSSITAWRDKSGQGNNATPYNSPTVSGRNVVLNGTNQYFTCPNVSYRPCNIFCVVTFTGSGYSAILRKGQVTGNTYEFSISVSNTTTLAYELRTSAGGQFNSYPTVSSCSGIQLYGMTYDNSTVTAYFNATSVASGTFTGPVFSGNTSLFLGVVPYDNNTPFTGYFQGSFQEFIIYTTPPTTAQRQLVEGYLARKWGLLSSLPGTHPYKTTPLFTRPFQPTDILGCSLWLDAADASSLTLSGSSVTQWNDKSGNGYNATTSAGTPTYSASTGITFPGTAHMASSVLSSVNTESGFIVLNNTVTGYQGVLGCSISGGREIRIQSAAEGNVISVLSRDLVGVLDSTIAFPKNTDTLLSYHCNSAFWFNGTARGTGRSNVNYAVNGAGTTIIGASGTSGGNRFTGTFKEIILYNFVLSATERQQVEGYLANKWGLRSSLPSTQPFKLFPPLTTLFNPLTLSGCSLWLDGADPSANNTTPSHNATVSTWVDKSGNGKNFTASSAAIYDSIARALVFNNNLYTSSYTAVVTNETLFVVFMPTQSQSMYVFYGNSATGGRGVGTYVNASSYGIVNAGITWGAISSGLNGTSTVNIAVSVVSSGKDTQISVNGNALTAVTTITAYSGSSTTLMGRDNNNAYPLYGRIYEIVAYNTVLSTSQRQQVEGYLASKWGLQPGLPSTHPFKRITP